MRSPRLQFLGVGALQGQVVGRPWWRGAIETLVIGGAAAVLAYGGGVLVAEVV